MKRGLPPGTTGWRFARKEDDGIVVNENHADALVYGITFALACPPIRFLARCVAPAYTLVR